ncbi:MAG: thiaminase II [Gammaproteobacteria bacterium]
MNKLSQKAWEKSYNVVEAIKQHPFNKALSNGTLSIDTFAYYIEQDTLYLREFARCHAIIASRVPLEYVQCFLRYSQNTFITEQLVVHDFFRKLFQFKETGLITPTTLSYTSYLLKVCALESVEIAIAAVLPCFWVYWEVGSCILQNTVKDNIFIRWIETYASDDFASSVKEAISIFDKLAASATKDTQDKMMNAFYNSTVLEWHFWNDSFNKTSVDNFLSKQYD